MAAVATVVALPVGMAIVWIPREFDRLESEISSRIQNGNQTTEDKLSKIDAAVTQLAQIQNRGVLTRIAQMELIAALRNRIQQGEAGQVPTRLTLAGFGNVDVPGPSVALVYDGRTFIGVDTSSYGSLTEDSKQRLFGAARGGLLELHVLDTDQGRALLSEGLETGIVK